MEYQQYLAPIPLRLKPELIIMYTWDVNGCYDNRVCGHMYEVIEYFWALKDNFDAKIIFPQEYDLDRVLAKYDFNETEQDQIRRACIPRPKTGIVRTRKGNGLVLIVDGNLGNFKGFIYGIPVQFSCGKLGLVPTETSQKWYLLHDKRICNPNEFAGYTSNPATMVMNYTKKILFDRIPQKKLKQEYYEYPKPKILLYLTFNCKYLNEEQIIDTIRKYSKIDPKWENTWSHRFMNYIIVTDYEININNILDYTDPSIEIKVINIEENPIDIFDLDFSHYIYTNVKREWDCSNRLIPECSHHRRNVFLNITYEDKALKTRLTDSIDTTQTLYLNEWDALDLAAKLNYIHEVHIDAKEQKNS